ncbi:ParB/RepB/Spo0J family partition protein [Salisediminibacterium halotolerans]|uniref:ParB/RepB/Spo0J family partition protein n=1 Tax=Salisediminibacterium halotolerans TaxID=517425 RepID=UPI000EB2ED67|nr:ParB/RepB/Spo0J family partition protein [Salisediminibacterium halotolerans]RLJ69724.1 chromosome segregation DNA-binding protein [Actinophytocola xinjiangensis]RPE89782.1 chromosome segregation DNA-binding protein [Salisediminibacterium halotolerans]TWG32618.1 chromosome segregation DNA-binding protein [Salisediminibacterium halotolerans]GEL07570.1 stage 0 sporulation protein J [Salisediminibacterium halotolerans]
MARGLGKGIGAFFPESEQEEDNVQEVRIADLRPNPYQPRKDFNDGAIDELKSSIEQHGILQPLIVRQSSIKGYEIVVGERRYRAAKEAGLKTVPAVVKDLTEDEMMEMALVENLQRENLTALEEAKAYQKLMEHLQMTQDELAKRLGKSRPHIANHLRLLQAPHLVQEYLAEGKISSGHARALLGLKNENQLTAVLQKIIKEHMNVRQLEAWIQQANENVSRETRKKPALPPYLRERESDLKSYFGTNVAIKKGQKKGKIEIDFFSEEDLDRILQLMQKEEDEV